MWWGLRAPVARELPERRPFPDVAADLFAALVRASPHQRSLARSTGAVVGIEGLNRTRWAGVNEQHSGSVGAPFGRALPWQSWF